MAIELAPLWNFNDPALSEQRFRAALTGASGDDALILQTQIARTLGLRGRFDEARQLLDHLLPLPSSVGAEVRVRHALELGRTWASAKHTEAQQTPQAKAKARQAYNEALAIARENSLDGLAIDAIHMLAFVDTAPADQLHWAESALRVATQSSQPAARRWEPSIRNNLGYALHQLGRLDDALMQFNLALALREQGDDADATRVARWMVAWTLRGLNRRDEALALQLQLEAECAAAGAPDPYVLEELALLYRERGDTQLAEDYEARRAALR